MVHRAPQTRCALTILAASVVLATAGQAQQGPVAVMFADDQQREKALASSFLSVDVPPRKGGAPLHVYLSAGDLERAFDQSRFRPDAAIVPTNTDLDLAASSPGTQRVLIDRVRTQPDVMRDLEDQAAARLRQAGPAASGGGGRLQIGIDTFLAHLPRGAKPGGGAGAFPGTVCLLPTDFPLGGAVDRRELFSQDRVRKGIAACLGALDAAGARSLVVPLVGASSSETQTNDPVYEGQRLLKECRLINAVAGIALGVHDFAATHKNVRELGIVQWDREVTGMFNLPGGGRLAEAAYRVYAEQVQLAVQKGLKGEKTTPGDVDGNCAITFNAR
jgi:hypothetical protein